MFLAVFWAGILINVLSITKILPFSGIFDYTIVAFFCNHAILFIAIFFGKTTDMLVRGRETVFEHYSSAAIIMDLNKNIVQMNLVARDILNFRFELNNDTTYDDLIKVWFEKNNGHFEDDNGDMLAVLNPEGGKPLYYKILETPISADKKTYIGSFVEMLDVTSNKELIAQLYELINRDGLTGVYNKRFFNEICQKYDSNQYLPLAIIFGDLNGLKAVNDTQGHEIGDHIIVKAAEILNIAATDEGTVVCRIGGDEFGVVIPNASRTMAERYIECVLRLCDEESSGTTEQISISLGFSIKTDMGQVLVEAIKLADMKMYENKRNRQWDT